MSIQQDSLLIDSNLESLGSSIRSPTQNKSQKQEEDQRP